MRYIFNRIKNDNLRICISLVMGHMDIEDVDGFKMGRSVVETDIVPPSQRNTRRENNRR